MTFSFFPRNSTPNFFFWTAFPGAATAGGDRAAAAGDDATIAGVPGSDGHQDRPGHGDRCLQEDAGERGGAVSGNYFIFQAGEICICSLRNWRFLS